MNEGIDRSRLAIRRAKWLFIGLIPLAFFIPVPHYGPTFDRVLDAGHLFVFAAIGFLVMRRLESLPIWVAGFGGLIICGVIGLTIELCQPMFSRRASLPDWWIDLCGSAIGIGFAIASTSKSAAVRRGIACVAAVVLIGCAISIVLGSMPFVQ